MTVEELKERIGLGEDSKTEFKSERAHPDDLAAAMVSFANTSGGVLILGVEDDGAVSGVGDVDAALLRISEISRNNIEPSLAHIHIQGEKHLVGGKRILLIDVQKGHGRPYRTNKGVYYVRSLAGKKTATREELLHIFQSAGSLFPDESPAPGAAVGDLNDEYLETKRPEMRGLPEPERIRSMTNAKILADGVPTIGGLLCYGKEPQKSNPNFRISAIRQEGVESSEEFIDRLEIGGPIENQINGALAFLRRHIPAASGIYATPFEAFDEAVINAAAHRDYMLNAQIRVFIYDDRLEVISPGRLLNTVTAETMRLGFHIVRNPVIFSFLSMCGLVTAAGRGIPNMLRALRAANFPAPEFVVVGAEFRVAFPLKP